jgi:replicative superfamily II helicase
MMFHFIGRVIIRSMYFSQQIISAIQYRQMCGRAGRAGLVEYGDRNIRAIYIYIYMRA